MNLSVALRGLVALSAIGSRAYAQPYSAHIITAPAGTTAQAWGANVHGVVVGEYDPGTGTLPFRWDAANGSVMLPQLPGHTGGGAYAINDQGQIAGWAWDGSKRQAVIWNNSTQTPTLLGWSGSNGAAAMAINNLGVAVGDDGAGHPYRYVPGSGAVPLTPLPGLLFAIALGINNFGEIAGVSFSNLGGAPLDISPTTVWTAAGVASCPPCTAADPNACQSSPGPGHGCVLSFGATIDDNDVLCMSNGAGLAIKRDGTFLLQAGAAAAGASNSGAIALSARSNNGSGPLRSYISVSGSLSELPAAGFDTTTPNAMTSNGIVAGSASYSSGPKNSTALAWLPSSFTCPGDVNNDARVDLSDLGILLSNFGRSGASYAQGDLTGDGNVDLSDLGLLLGQYGATCN